MTLDLVYFAWVRERVGLASERVTVPPEVTDVARLIAWLADRGPDHAAAFAEPSRLRAAIDQRFVSHDASLDGAKEVALFPPVTGG